MHNIAIDRVSRGTYCKYARNLAYCVVALLIRQKLGLRLEAFSFCRIAKML